MRTFLPALRDALTGQSSSRAPAGVEGKSLLQQGYASYASHSTFSAGGGALGARAAGWDMDQAVVEGFERVVWVYKCVDRMAGDFASLPFRIGKNLDTDDQETILDHPLYRVMNRRANPLEKGYDFKYRLATHLLLSKKGAFVEVTKSLAGVVTRLDLLDPQRVRPVPSDNGEYLSHYEYTYRNGGMVELPLTKVRWVKKPHPTDPFSSVIPIEAAGVSIEMDFLSRVHNVQFIKNDARPGGIVGVDADGMSEEMLKLTESKFQPGVHTAGKITVMGTGPGGLNYVDTSTTPRDMAYKDMSDNARDTILAAFGFGESVLGNAAGRSWDNAEQELFNYWTLAEGPFMNILARAFDDDVDDAWDCFMDTSTIGALELPRRKAREEARLEVTQGLRSIDEYRPMAGLTAIGNAQTRALWVSPAKAPIPASPEDAAELGSESGAGAPGPGPDGAPAESGVPGEVPSTGRSAAQAVQDALESPGEDGSAAAAVRAAQTEDVVDEFAPTPAADAVQAAQLGVEREPEPAELEVPEGEAADAVARARMERKTLQDGGVIMEAPADADYARVQAAVAGALEGLMARHATIVAARMQAPKTRQGTRYWEAANPDDDRVTDEGLDPEQVVPRDRFVADAVETVGPIAQANSAEAATGTLEAFAAAGALGGAYTAAELGRSGAWAATETVAAAIGIVVDVFESFLDGLVDAFSSDYVATTTTLPALVDLGRDYYTNNAASFADTVGEAVAYTVINGARDAAASMMVPAPGALDDTIVRTWITQEDSRVREAHRATAGATLPVGEPFTMDGGSVRFPRDPAGPPRLTYGCRCRLAYSVGDGMGRLIVPTPTP